MPKYLLLMALACALPAQTPTAPAYTAADVFTASAGEALTIQLAANSPTSVIGGTISGSVSAASTICFSWNGTAATSTALAISPAPGSPFQATATAWKTSNAGAGTTGPCFVLATGAFSFTGPPNFYLWKRNAPTWASNSPWAAVQNFTATITPSTGTVSGNLNMTWGQQ